MGGQLTIYVRLLGQGRIAAGAKAAQKLLACLLHLALHRHSVFSATSITHTERSSKGMIRYMDLDC